MDQLAALDRRRRNLRIVLFIIILSTLPFYLCGIVLWGTARQTQSTIPTGTATFTPIGFTQGPTTATLFPSITPLVGTSTGISPLQPTPFQFVPVPTRFLTSTPIFGPTNLPQPTAAPTLTPNPLPVAAFSANPTSGTAPLTVQFTDQSTGNITIYAWNFGDGNTGTTRNPSHIYDTPGSHTVTLTVTGPGGSNSAQATISVSAPAQSPTASFTGSPNTGNAPLAVQFTDQSTGNITSYSWDFGDGVGSSSQQNPAYTFANPGSYTVTLTVTGPGGSDSSQGSITVNTAPQAPVAQFSANPTSGNAPLAVQFSDQSTGNISSYSWSFGDGVGASTQQNPAYTYNNPGNYTVTLTVTGPGGSNSTQTVISVSASVAAPVAQFSANPTSGTSPLAVQFTDQSTGNITSYSWNFGDGVGGSTQQSPSYVYNTPGIYTVTLTVTGPGGSNSTQTVISADALPFDTPAP